MGVYSLYGCSASCRRSVWRFPFVIPWALTGFDPLLRRAQILQIKNEQGRHKPLSLLCKDISTMNTYAKGIDKVRLLGYNVSVSTQAHGYR